MPSSIVGNPNLVAPTMLSLKDVLAAPTADGTIAFVKGGVPSSMSGRAIYVLNKLSGLPENLVTGSIVSPGPGSPIAGAAAARWLLLGPVLVLGLFS